MRAQSRIFAFKVIFATLFGSDADATLQNFDENILLDKDKDFAMQILNKFLAHKEEIENDLNNALENYQQDRIYKVDLALIFLAIAEMRFVGTPKPVVVNEVLEIAKKFSTEKSQKFINGVLAKID